MNEKEIIENLLENNFNENLTEDLIKKLIAYDFKVEVMPNEKQLIDFYNSRYPKTKKMWDNLNITSNFSLLEYNPNDIDLKNWYKYKTLGHLNYPLDCDTSILTWKIINKTYDIPVRNFSETRHFYKNGCKFESDSMNSFLTICSKFMYKNLVNYLQTNNMNVPDKITSLEREYLILNNLDNIYNTLNETDKKIFLKLNLFARLTHTFGNFSLVPFGYNVYRYKLFKDFWDNSYNYLNANEKLMPELDDINLVLSEYKDKSNLTSLFKEENYETLLDIINTFILKRGIKILKIIDKNLSLSKEQENKIINDILEIRI